MQELRQVVGVLRTAGDDVIRSEIALAGLADLLEEARRTAEVTADIDDDLDLPPGVAVTVYRTIQEALTNARRHAPGAPLRVCVHQHGDLEITVDDAPGTVAPGGTPGFGLIGLAERANLYDGTFEAGPRADGSGWRVRLRLPYTARPAVETTVMP
jgi:signal transduction histidine kinase